MSRSYRKNTWVVDGQGSCKKEAKRRASRAVRRSDVGNGGEYKKHSCSWNIADYRWLEEKPTEGRWVGSHWHSLEQLLEHWNKTKRK